MPVQEGRELLLESLAQKQVLLEDLLPVQPLSVERALGAGWDGAATLWDGMVWLWGGMVWLWGGMVWLWGGMVATTYGGH